MSWRGTLRTLAAAARQHEREQHRRHRLLQQRQQQLARLNAAQRAAHEVEVYENSIELITSVHRDCGEVWNWDAIKKALPPAKPEYSSQIETTQRQREAQRQPGFWDRVTGRLEEKVRASEQAIHQAKAADQARHDAATQEYEGKLEEWKTLQRIAAGVLAGDVKAFKEALDELKPFDEIKEIGRNVQMNFTARYVEATIWLHGPEIIPGEIKTLLKNGTVSKKSASEGFLHQTYQQHVCSCMLRAARELFAALPFQKAFVHGMASLLNPQTGNKEPRAIISVLIPRTTFASLNLENVDPVECMRNFLHQMAFSKFKGFAPVNPLNPRDYDNTPSHCAGSA
jgi:hypothetical protein